MFTTLKLGMVLATIICINQATGETANITIPPRAVNVSINGVAEFNCTGVCKDLIWMDNGHQLHDGDNGDRVNITHAIPVNLSQNVRMSILRMTATSADNAVKITCIASWVKPISSDESDPALLLVQGLLESVSNLAVVPYINSTTFLISWSPPFTLEGVPILGYNVIITNTTSGENETMSVEGNTTMVYYSIDHPDPGNNFTVTMIPINVVGLGESASTTFSVNPIVSTSQVFVSTSSLPDVMSKSSATQEITSFFATPTEQTLPVQSTDGTTIGIPTAFVFLIVIVLFSVGCGGGVLIYRRHQNNKRIANTSRTCILGAESVTKHDEESSFVDEKNSSSQLPENPSASEDTDSQEINQNTESELKLEEKEGSLPQELLAEERTQRTPAQDTTPHKADDSQKFNSLERSKSHPARTKPPEAYQPVLRSHSFPLSKKNVPDENHPLLQDIDNDNDDEDS